MNAGEASDAGLYGIVDSPQTEISHVVDPSRPMLLFLEHGKVDSSRTLLRYLVPNGAVGGCALRLCVTAESILDR